MRIKQDGASGGGVVQADKASRDSASGISFDGDISAGFLDDGVAFDLNGLDAVDSG
jgi:hypothetical protein